MQPPFLWHQIPLPPGSIPQTRDFNQEVFQVSSQKYINLANNFVQMIREFNKFLFCLRITHFAVPATIKVAIGAVLALLFCGMSCVFMKIKRKKCDGKDDFKIANEENSKKLPKTGIFYQKPMYRTLLFYHLPEFHRKFIIFKLTGIRVSITVLRL